MRKTKKPLTNPRIYNNERLLLPGGGRARESFIFIRRIPADLKLQFKAYCARRGWSMTDWMVSQMKAALKEEPKDYLNNDHKTKAPRTRSRD